MMLVVLFNLFCCLMSGQSWAHMASTEPYRDWSSATAGRDLVSNPHLPPNRYDYLSDPNDPAHEGLTVICLCVCEGVKIIGGYRELTGEEFGIYVKRVVVGGLAAQDGACFFGPTKR